MNDLFNRQNVIEALKICNNGNGTICKECPIRSKGCNSAWWIGNNYCWVELKRRAAELLSVQSEIIHCRECALAHSEVWLSGTGAVDASAHCGRTGLLVFPYSFCSFAIRREI